MVEVCHINLQMANFFVVAWQGGYKMPQTGQEWPLNHLSKQ